MAKTFSKLYAYYKPYNFYDKMGYYSETYNQTYYDGYGYNFYYGAYGYYQNSPTDIDFSNLIVTIVIAASLILVCCLCPAYAYYTQKQKEFEDF